ncbi:unnamed protein product [Oikopleura dioica]|uniref:Uncharacterized protein n=1 Tax=Oikopleura dioica TaxID=34765 RepID=E4Y0K6_OIKDI|nr:unnamed protein product [Oikopleura dioica]
MTFEAKFDYFFSLEFTVLKRFLSKKSAVCDEGALIQFDSNRYLVNARIALMRVFHCLFKCKKKRRQNTKRSLATDQKDR